MNIKYPKFICLVACVIAFMLGGIATHHLDNLTIKNIVDANNQAQISNQIENLQILHGLKIGKENFVENVLILKLRKYLESPLFSNLKYSDRNKILLEQAKSYEKQYCLNECVFGNSGK